MTTVKRYFILNSFLQKETDYRPPLMQKKDRKRKKIDERKSNLFDRHRYGQSDSKKKITKIRSNINERRTDYLALVKTKV